MKAAETKISSGPANKASSFFKTEGRSNFFADGQSSFFGNYPIQAKLTVNQPGDQYEREADNMADKVVQRLSNNEPITQNKSNHSLSLKTENYISHINPAPVQTKCASCEQEEKMQLKENEEAPEKEKIQKKPIFESNAEPPDESNTVQRKCAACEQEEKMQLKENEEVPVKEKIQRKPTFESNAEPPVEGNAVQRKCAACEKEEKMQMKENKGQPAGDIHLKSFDTAPGNVASSSVESGINASKGSGSQLPSSVRSSMESSFGVDFSGVRIHNDSRSQQLSSSLNAQAFTHGSDIYFNSGKYDTSSKSGQHLLAHELTHTIQQGSSPYAAKKAIQRVCDHSTCAGDRMTPSCPTPQDFLLNPKLDTIRKSIFDSTQHPEILSKDMSDEAVVLVRKLLLNVHCEGFDRLVLETEPEQIFSSELKRAVMFFQLHHKDVNGEPLVVDGDIGPATLGAMDVEMGLSPIPIPKKAEGKGHCFGEAKQGPGIVKTLIPTNPDYLHFQPFFPAVKAWEISNFDIAKFFLKTEHREFLRSTVVPDITDTVAKSKSKLKVRVIGEASTTWTNAFNMQLSKDRADCMVSALKEFGLDAGLLESPVTALGEELASVLPVIQGKSPVPIDNTEDLTARKVTLVLVTDKTDDCGDDVRTRPSINFLAHVACHSPNSYLINIMSTNQPNISGLVDPPPIYREFKWITVDDTSGCMFTPTGSPREFQFVLGFRALQLAKKDPDNPFAPSDFIGNASHFTRKSGESTIERGSALSSFLIPLPGKWQPPHCAKDNAELEGTMFPLGPVKCGMMPVPTATDQCKPKEDCPPEKRQRPAKKFKATMKRVAADPLKIARKIPRLRDVMKKIDDFLDFFGIKVSSSVTAAQIKIGTADDDKNPVQRSFYFVGGELTTSSRSILDVNFTYADDFTIEDPKYLEKPGGDSDFTGRADLTIKGGTNHEELLIKSIGKPIVFKGLFCQSGKKDPNSTGYLETFSPAICELLDAFSMPDRKCEDEKEDCPDDQKLKGDQKFIIKIGRATIADLPVAGKKLADSMGCGVTAAFINIGTASGDDKEKIYRKFLLVAKNNDCRYAVEKSSETKSFFIERVLSYPDPNDIDSLSDFIGIAFLNASSNLDVVAPKNFPFQIRLPGKFDSGCTDPRATGAIIPISAVDCGPVPDPSHSTTPDTTDLNRCEDFKKKNLALINNGIADLKFKWARLTDRITNPPQLLYPLYNNLFFHVGKTIPNAVFFGKASDGQKVITVVDMHVLSVFTDPVHGFVFDVRFVSEPCSYNESGQPVFVLPKDCKEAFINIIEIFPIYPIPEDDTDIKDRDDNNNDDTPKKDNKKKDDKMHDKCPGGDCHSAGIVPVPFGPDTKPFPNIKDFPKKDNKMDEQCPNGDCHSTGAVPVPFGPGHRHFPKLDLQKPSLIHRKCEACEQKEIIQPKPGFDRADEHVQRCAACEEKEKNSREEGNVQGKPVFENSDHDVHLCAACEKEKQLQKKSAMDAEPAMNNIEAQLSSSKGAGQQMPADIRNKMETSFGADFSGVRIHDNSSSAQMNEHLHAKAFTHGRDIYFNSGNYNTDSHSGKHLLAHELTHTIQQNASASKSIQRDSDLPIGPPKIPGADAITLKSGIVVSEDEFYLRDLVINQIKNNGTNAGQDLIKQVEAERADVQAQQPSGGVTDQSQANTTRIEKLTAILDKLRPVVAKIDQDNKVFLIGFQADAEKIFNGMLDDSETRVKTEALKYGIKVIDILELGMGGAEGGPGSSREQTVMDSDTSAVKGLAASAQILLTKRNEINTLKADQEKLVVRRSCIGDYYNATGNCDYYLEGYQALQEKIDYKSRDYQTIQFQLQASFPILASFSSLDDKSDRLSKVAQGSSQDSANILYNEIKEKLINIEDARAGLTPGGIWKVKKIIDLTQASKGIGPDTMEARVIKDKYDAENSKWLEIVLAVIGLAFALLAPVTGGLSLIVTAAISTGVALDHLNDYMLESARAGSDFDKAKAVSEEDPSLFWLAVDIVAAIADIVAAGSTFKAMAGGVRAYQIAKTGEEAAEISKAEKLIQDAGQGIKLKSGEDLAQTVLSKLRTDTTDSKSILKSLNVDQKELQALEDAAKAGDEAIKSKGLLEKASSDTMKVTKNGVIFSCSSPCAMLREKFAEALAKKPGLLSRVEAMEQKALKASLDPANENLAKQLKEELATLEAELKSVSTSAKLALIEKIKELKMKHPILAKLDDSAIERLAAKGANADHIKGQLLEELLGTKLQDQEELLKVAGDKAAAQASKSGSKLEFIPGHAITDADGKLLTDGVIGYYEGDKFHIVTVFESKAGKASSKGLARSYKRFKKLKPDDVRELKLNAIEDMIDRHHEWEKLGDSQVEKIIEGDPKLKSEMEALMKQLNTSESGQVRKSSERLFANEGSGSTTILIDGKPVSVVGSPKQSKFVGVVPDNVDTAAIQGAVKDDKLNFDILKAGVDADELREASKDIAKVSLSQVGP